MKPALTLFDSLGICHWLFHRGGQEMLNEDGVPCGMVHGLREWLSEYLDRFEPAYAVACFDGAKNFRKTVDVEYKSARKPLDSALAVQLPQAPAVFAEFGIKCLRVEAFEADDLIASLVVAHACAEVPTLVISSDKDLAALIDEHTHLFDPRPDKEGQTHIYDAARWEAKTQIPPHRMTEYLALVGDAADSVKGVDGWGKVKAVNAIVQTKSWPELERKARAGQLQKITTKNQEALVAQLEAFWLAHSLVSLRYDVPITETLAELAWHHPATPGATTAEDDPPPLTDADAPFPEEPASV